MKRIHIEKPEINPPLFHRFIERMIGFDDWLEKNKKAFLLKNNPAEYAKIYDTTRNTTTT